MPLPDAVEEGVIPHFRPVKRRKVGVRRPAESADSDSVGTIREAPAKSRAEKHTAGDAQDDDFDAQSSVVRKVKPTRQQSGLTFASSERRRSPSMELSLVHEASKSETATEIAQRRFAPQTGMVHEVEDQHMDAYIDSQLNRLLAKSSSESTGAQEGKRQQVIAGSSTERTDHDPYASGKLIEVPLPANTTSSRGRQTSPSASTPQVGARRRKGQARTREDEARDSLVDAVLNETTISYYDQPEQEAYQGGEDADAEFAKRFETEYMEQIEERNALMEARMKQQAATKKTGQTEAKGPKMGGSRSSRANAAKGAGPSGR